MIVIEHNLEVIKTADWLIDLGPEGGSGGGLVIAEGTPEDVANTPGSYTGHFLRPLLGLEGNAPKATKPVATKKKAVKAAEPKPKVARKK